MAPPTTAARLYAVDVVAFGETIERYAAKKLKALGHSLEYEHGASPIASVARRVARFAQIGIGAEVDVERAQREVRAKVRRLDELLLERGVDAIHGKADESWLHPHLYDSGTDVGVIMLAAKARLMLLDGQDVSSVWLAALADLSRVRIAQMIRAGVLRRAATVETGRAIDAPVLHADAIRMLTDRAVNGYPRPDVALES